MDIELRQLRYVIAAADQRSFRRAAEGLRLRQSTLSRRIRDVELQLGVGLFERSHAGVRPTLAGAEFVRIARNVVEEVDRMAAAATAAGRGEAGRLVVGFYTSLSAGNLRLALQDFKRFRPDVEIATVEGTRARLFSGLSNGAIDVAVVTGDLGNNRLESLPLWSERVIVALPESHALASNEIVFWTDLRGETFLLSQKDPGPEIQDILVSKLAAPGDRPKVVRHDASGENIKSLVGAGFGVSLICEASIGGTFSGVVYREARDGNGPTSISYAAHWDRDNTNPALSGFVRLLRERFAPLNTRP
ncbi:LysR substrate-binding domain-containing protein [Methylocystis sp. 9N]|uniref:LysR substrate-binding domain-containing protein n=1 Tax=Methylocystis borbori TaxID=3118750 RepID=A0ABU7XDV0_9HYPH